MKKEPATDALEVELEVPGASDEGARWSLGGDQPGPGLPDSAALADRADRAFEATAGCSTSTAPSTSVPSLTLNLTSQLLDSLAAQRAASLSLQLTDTSGAHLPGLSVLQKQGRGGERERDLQQLLVQEHKPRGAEGDPPLLQAQLAAAAQEAGPSGSGSATLFHQLLDTKPSVLPPGLPTGPLPSSSTSSSFAGSASLYPSPRSTAAGPASVPPGQGAQKAQGLKAGGLAGSWAGSAQPPGAHPGGASLGGGHGLGGPEPHSWAGRLQASPGQGSGSQGMGLGSPERSKARTPSRLMTVQGEHSSQGGRKTKPLRAQPSGGSSGTKTSLDAEEYSLSPPQKKHRLFGKDLVLAVGKDERRGRGKEAEGKSSPSDDESPHGLEGGSGQRHNRGRRAGGAGDEGGADLDELGQASQSTRPRSVAERRRRGKISMRLEKLKETLPVWNPRMDTATMLDEAIGFINSLRRDNRRLEVENEILLKSLPPGTPRPHVVVNEKMEIQVLHAAPP